MNKKIEITVRLFGAFRRYGERIVLSAPSGSSIADIITLLSEKIEPQDKVLLNDSAMANDNEIVGRDFILSENSELAILPPVCGG